MLPFRINFSRGLNVSSWGDPNPGSWQRRVSSPSLNFKHPVYFAAGFPASPCQLVAGRAEGKRGISRVASAPGDYIPIFPPALTSHPTPRGVCYLYYYYTVFIYLSLFRRVRAHRRATVPHQVLRSPLLIILCKHTFPPFPPFARALLLFSFIFLPLSAAFQRWLAPRANTRERGSRDLREASR